MLAIPVVLVLTVGACLALVAPVLAMLYRRTRLEDISAAWLDNFTPRAYYPMERLLNQEDFTFLSRQPGFDIGLYRKFRRDRLQIFDMYLKRMIGDFNRIHLAARLLLASSKEDRSDLLGRLVWLKVRFSVAVLEARYRYLLCCLGLRSLPARALILRLEEINEQFSLIRASLAAS